MPSDKTILRILATSTSATLIICVIAAVALLGSGTIPQAVNRGGPGTTNTPIVVNGGAMTAHQKTPWVVNNSNTSYCAPKADTSYLEFINVQPDPNHKPPPPLPLVLSNLTGDWTLTIHGWNPNSATPYTASGNGLVIAGQTSSGCGTLPSVQVSPIPSSYSQFYPGYAVGDDPTRKMRYSARFHDTSTSCTASGDQDFCEHIANFQLKLNYPDVGQKTGDTTTYYFTCPDGECSIGIGKAP